VPSTADHAEVDMFLDVASVYPGAVASESAMRAVLDGLSRDDALLFCARINALVSGYSPRLSAVERQAQALSLLCSPHELATTAAYRATHGNPVAFFRGQILELARNVAIHCTNLEGDGETFHNQTARSSFLHAALIASGLWSTRIYGGRLLDEGTLEQQLHRALGAFRKGVEESNMAPHTGVAIGRGWLLFSKYLPARLADFDALFESATHLTLQQYYVCSTALMKFTFPDWQNGRGHIFRTEYVPAGRAYAEIFRLFMNLEAQSVETLKAAFLSEAKELSFKALREKPIVSFDGQRSAILDPAFYSEHLTISPLFHVLAANKARANEIFGAFGFAFEDYATELLEGMYPTGEVLHRRLSCRIPGHNAAGEAFEVDALLNNVTAAAVFEMKASWIREDRILTADFNTFIEELRRKYGYVPSSGERPKGVAQLAKIIGAIVRGEWTGEHDDFQRLTHIYPVLMVHDERMAAAGLGSFLDREFRQLLGDIPRRIFVHRLIVMTIADLENLASSVEHFSLMELLGAYSRQDPERMRSVHNFMATSEYAIKIVPSAGLIAATQDLMQIAKVELFPDAQRLTEGFIADITASPFRIAPERREELLKDVFGGTPYCVDFRHLEANFWGNPPTREITISFPALLSLWATAHASLLLSHEAAQAMRRGERELDSHSNSAVALAYRLIEAAQALIRNESSAWPSDLPLPNAAAPGETHDGAVNNLFLGAVSWITLHEVAHIHLNHLKTATDAVRRDQEHEADLWATGWILQKVPDEEERAYRIFATATALAWIGLLDDVRRGSTTHPHASERFGQCFAAFGAQPESAGLELASYLVKALFNPDIELPDTETPEDSLINALIMYSKRPR
jgi:hypothetical protein